MRWIFTDTAGQTMHNMMGHIGMEHDSHNQQNSEQDSHYSNDGWGVPINNYSSPQQTSPIFEYHNFPYMNNGLPHSLPVEPTFTRMPPPLAPHSHQQLLPLIMPSHPTWPSMLTNPAGYQAPPVAIPPSSAAMKAAKLAAHPAPSPRKTLTDQDRRRMCQYHEDNPSVKQTEIGAMFGVERSTVSKVLRQKEKYLFPEDRSASPVKRQKGKFPDIDRALSSWVRNSQRQGVPLTDAAIKEKARVWASTVGNSESSVKANSASWLEKFKQKNNIGGAKLTRRASETNISDAGTFSQDSAGPSVSHTPSGHSPGSPRDLASPLSGSKGDASMKPDTMDDYMAYSSSEYRHSNSQSTTSLSSAFTDTVNSFSGDPSSPGTPFTFSPETTQGPFATPQYARSTEPSYPQRPRSQTFPMLNVDPTAATTPTFPPSATSPPPLDASAPPSATTATTTSPVSPTQDDARRALETFLSYMALAAPQGLVNETEYQTFVKVTERMRQHSLGTIGNLSRISEGEGEGGRMSVGA